MSDLSLQIEALLVASPSPVAVGSLEKLYSPSDVSAALEKLREFWEARGMRLGLKNGIISFSPAPEVVKILAEAQGEKVRSLSTAAIETLCYISMNQPVTLADIEQARGLKLFKGIMDSLLDAGFVRAAVRRSDSGRAITYVTTDAFLEHFGLGSLSDLPRLDELPDLVDPPTDDD